MKTTIINLTKLFFFLGILTIISCDELEFGNDFLEDPPELQYSLDSVFSNATRARELLWNAYSTLPVGLGYHQELKNQPIGWKSGVGGGNYMVPVWSMTDLTRDKTPWGRVRNWERGTVTAQNVQANGKYAWFFRLGWDGIRDSYIFIENIDRVPDISQAEKDRLKAEAKIIIATHYVEMFQHYGGIIWLNHAYAPDEDMTKERLTISQTVDTLTSLIDEAIPFLPFELENPETWSGRITSAAAMGLKVKFLSFAAAPLFNNDQPFLAGEAATKELVWTGGYQPYLWEMLRDAAKELIDKIEASSYYRMTNTGNPQDDYKRSYFNRTPETLYSTRGPYKWNWGELPDIIRNNHWMATTVPLHNYAMKFPMKNGMSIEDPASGYDPKNPYYNRDPRLYESLVVNGGYWQGRKAELYNGGRERKNKRIKFSFAGYQLRKWRLDMQEVYGETPQWPYVRIPEIYLAYAEALNELNNGPTTDAFKYVNKIRERVDVGPIEDFIGKPQNAITKQEFLDALLNERAIELGCENVRWFDMSRYKLKDVFTSKDLAMDITLKVNRSSFDFSNVDFNEHDQYFEYVITELPNEFYWQEPSQFDPKYYLEPIPFSEIQKDYGLIQNPGWEL